MDTPHHTGQHPASRCDSTHPPSVSRFARDRFEDPQVAYNDIIMTGFNLAITALPPFFLAIFERDIDEALIHEVSIASVS